MGRRKKPWRDRVGTQIPVLSHRHQSFIDMVESAELMLPHVFNNWRRFFLDEESFLDEAETWLSMRLQGRFHRIVDDVDRGLMTRGGAAVEQRDAWADQDYWDAWNGWSGGFPAETQGRSRFSDFYTKTLPLTPKIPAPSGLSGAGLVAL